MSLPDNIVELFVLVTSELAGAIDEAQIDLPMSLIRILKALARSPCTPLVLATRLHKDKGQLTRMLNDCKKRGLVVSSTNELDRRSKVIALTEEGRALLSEVNRIEATVVDRMTRGVTDQRVRAFNEVLEALIGNVVSEASVDVDCCE